MGTTPASATGPDADGDVQTLRISTLLREVQTNGATDSGLGVTGTNADSLMEGEKELSWIGGGE